MAPEKPKSLWNKMNGGKWVIAFFLFLLGTVSILAQALRSSDLQASHDADIALSRSINNHKAIPMHKGASDQFRRAETRYVRDSTQQAERAKALAINIDLIQEALSIPKYRRAPMPLDSVVKDSF